MVQDHCHPGYFRYRKSKYGENDVVRNKLTLCYQCHLLGKGKVRRRRRWQVSRPQGAQAWITQFNLQTTPCLPLAFVRVHQMAPPRTVVTTSSCNLLLIYRPRKDERMSWRSWLTYSGRFTHISGHLSAVGRTQDCESSPVKDQRSTAAPRNQPF